MTIKCTEWGRFEAMYFFDVDLDKLNEDIRAEFVTEGIRPVEEKDIAAVVEYGCTANCYIDYLDTTLVYRNDPEDAVVLLDYLIDYILNLKYQEPYGYEILEHDVDDDECTVLH